MLDRHTLKWIKAPLNQCARLLNQLGLTANQVTLTGFAFGILAMIAISFQAYWLGALFIIINRVMDGLDGALARLNQPTDLGAFLDIVLDFIFYSGIVFSFAIANPAENALAAAALIFSFMGTGASFLAFAIFAERRTLSSMRYPNKGFYYLNGLAEGTETIAVLLLMCVFSRYFAVIAWVFFGICVLTTLTRLIGATYSLKQEPVSQTDTTL